MDHTFFSSKSVSLIHQGKWIVKAPWRRAHFRLRLSQRVVSTGAHGSVSLDMIRAVQKLPHGLENEANLDAHNVGGLSCVLISIRFDI